MKDFINRFLPAKADIGFFQEYDSKIDKVKNSSTRLFQLAMVAFLFLFTKLIFTNLFASGPVDLNTLIFIVIFYLLTLIATFAPKQFKNIAEIRTLVELLKNKKDE